MLTAFLIFNVLSNVSETTLSCACVLIPFVLPWSPFVFVWFCLFAVLSLFVTITGNRWSIPSASLPLYCFNLELFFIVVNKISINPSIHPSIGRHSRPAPGESLGGKIRQVVVCHMSTCKMTWRHTFYDAIRDDILTCTQKLTQVSLIYSTEPKSKNWKTKT